MNNAILKRLRCWAALLLGLVLCSCGSLPASPSTRQVLQARSDGAVRLTTPPAGASDQNPAYSPDGGRLVLTRFDNGYGSSIGPDVAALAQMWQQALGVTITVELLESDHYLDEIYAGHHGQIFTTGWCADYPDPENFADVLFHTGSQQNQSNYSNPQVDTLLEQARVEQDVEKRIQLYQQVEQMIVDDAPVIFTTHNISYLLVKPYIQGYVLTPIDVPLERYLWIDVSKMK
jgi:oligopeptide transport system substrate-binding protein